METFKRGGSSARLEATSRGGQQLFVARGRPMIDAVCLGDGRFFAQNLFHSIAYSHVIHLCAMNTTNGCGGDCELGAGCTDGVNGRRLQASDGVDDGTYPSDLFTREQRRNGAWVLHFLGCIYMFIIVR